jgi:ArsR family transcriptional regulator
MPMDPKILNRFEARARVAKAMAHPTRLFILDRLASGEECVCRLTALIGADISTVSKHLSLLKDAGLIRDEKRGTQVFYRLAVPCVLKFFDCIESVIKDQLRRQEAALEPLK